MRPPVLREDVGEVAAEGLRREHHRQVERPVVHRHRRVVHVAAVGTREAVEVVERDRPRELPGAVGAEVEEHDRVAVAHRADRVLVGVDDDDRLDELVGDTGFVRGLERLDRRGRALLGDAFDDRVVAQLDPLPPLVAVHRVVAAGDRGDAAGAGLVEHGLQLPEVADAAGRRGVAAVGDHVDEHPRHALARGHLDQRVQVLLAAVDAAVREQADEVQRVLAVDAAIHRRGERRAREQLAVADALVDAREVLVDDPAGAHVHVADLGVAHLPGGQADRFAGRDQLRVRIPLQQRVVGRRARERDGVVLGLGPEPPAVEDDEDDR